MRTLVAGSHGMIGRNVVRLLDAKHTAMKCADLKIGLDLRVPEDCWEAIDGCDQVFHLADITAGLGYARTRHGQMLTDSLLISLNILKAAYEADVKDYLYVSSSCVYPDHYMDEAAPEHYADFLSPEQANEGYGWAKRIAEKQCVYFHREYGMRTIIARPANVYGPSYDWTRPVEDMHVIPALITKMLRGDKEIVVWGDGTQRRTFQYEEDTADLIVGLMKNGAAGEAYNLGGVEMTIRNLVDQLADACKYQGAVTYDASKPQGPQRKAHDISKLAGAFRCKGFEFRAPFRTTIEAAREALQSSRS